MKISVIVIHENRENQLGLCLAALEKQTMDQADYEVVLAGRAEKALVENRSCRLRYVEHLRGPEEKLNLSFLRNLGAGQAKGEVLAFLDCDIVVPANFLETVWQLHQGRELLSFCARRRLPREAKLLRPEDAGRARCQRDEREEVLPFFGGQFQNIRSGWLWVYGHTMCVNRSAFLRLGGFWEEFQGWGLEDSELAYRYSRAGIPLVYNQACTVCHIWHEEKFNRNRKEQYMKNLRAFQERYKDPMLYGLDVSTGVIDPQKMVRLAAQGMAPEKLFLFLSEMYALGYAAKTEEGLQ